MDSNTPAPKKKDQTPTCGLVMPISGIDGCPAEHWNEVKKIICEAVELFWFSGKMRRKSGRRGEIPPFGRGFSRHEDLPIRFEFLQAV